METVIINIVFSDEDTATHILDSIEPDNRPLPEGIHILCRVEDCNLIIEISSTRGIDSLRNTIEDILSAIDLSHRTITSIK